MKRLRINRREFLVVVAPTLVLAALASILPAQGCDAFERFLGPIHPAIAIIVAAAVAIPCLRFLVGRHGFAQSTWERTHRGLIVAAGAAMVFGVAVIIADVGLRYPAELNIAFPQSLIFYPAIGFFVGLVFHTILPALLLLLLRPLARWRGAARGVWPAILLAAIAEPMLQVMWAESLSWTELYTAVSVFLFGVTQLAIFRRYGFLSMVGMRLVYYLIWHIVWGAVRLELLF